MSIQDPQPTILRSTPSLVASAASNHPDSQARCDAQSSCAVGGQTNQQASVESKAGVEPVTKGKAPAGSNSPDAKNSAPRSVTRSGPDLTSSQRAHDTQDTCAAGDQATEGQLVTDSQEHRALGSDSPTSHLTPGTQRAGAGRGQASTDGRHLNDAQNLLAVRGPILADPILGMAADVVDDLEKIRVANENRYRTITAADEYGHGLSPEHPDVARLAGIVDALGKAEHQAILNLQRVMRNHPLGAWVKAQPGVGEKQAARLLAVIRDPYWNDLHDRPRTVSELWAYCGLHVLPASQDTCGNHSTSAGGPNVHPGSQVRHADQNRFAAGVAPKRQRGQKANWSEDARKRAWLIATSCMKQPAGTHYRDVYDATRLKYADAVHTVPCVRCGPAGKPAQPDTPLSLGHQHARALRAVAKELLKDLWREAKRIHEAADTEQEAAA